MLKALVQLALLPLPWFLRRLLLRGLFGYRIHPRARIGLAVVAVRRLHLGDGASIGHFTIVKGVELLELGDHASIGRGNWISGFPLGHPRHFVHQPERRNDLVIGAHAHVTNRHLLDCTGGIAIGPFSTLAGFSTQILTHSIDLTTNRQSSQPVSIGAYCFVGTDCVLLAGAALPERSVLGAMSLLNKAYLEVSHLYAGVPARPVKGLDPQFAYFHRVDGYVQ
ncbi:MAG: acyltransferase [Planctomycetes bacterium]|jgi:acetyltransferase-like isoleucine patch superfamily enzyme|nr:acyltransferase [Planctomycetota bacterium]